MGFFDCSLTTTDSQVQPFDEWLEGVQNRGRARKDVYDLIWDILRNYPGEFSELPMEQLAEAETGLTSFCTTA